MVERIKKAKAQNPRGFAMIIILIIALAGALIAGTMLVAAGTTAESTAHGKGGEVARELAYAGMQRSNAYLNTLVTTSGDFDFALDPDQVADCSALPSTPTCAAGTCNRPKFTDGASVTYNGKGYTVVGMNGGAYLIRYDDNADDQRTEVQWAGQTDNHNVHGCIEGPGIGGNGDNPLRDRDRAILVTVIGIWPGTNPNTATHRTTLRKLFIYRTDPTVPAFEAGHDVDGGGGTTQMLACSSVSGVQAMHDFTGGATTRTCTCGDSHTGSIGSFRHCNSIQCGVGTCASGTNVTPGPTAIHAWNNANFDWESPCNFYVEKNNPAGVFILWVWDPAGLRGPAGSCHGFSGAMSDPLVGPPDITTTGSYKNCWTPVVIDDAVADDTDATKCVSTSAGLGFPGADSIAGIPATNRCEWHPMGGNGAVPIAGTALNALMVGMGGGIAARAPPATAEVFTKPDWATQCQLPAPGFPGQPARISCAPDCDGTHNAFEDSTGSFGEYYVSGGDKPGINAVPAGAYYYATNLTLGGGESFGGAPSPSSGALSLDGMPLATIVVNGNLTVNGGNRGWFGAGRTLPGGNFPAIVVSGDFVSNTSPGTLRIAGSIYTGNDFKWSDTGLPTPRRFDGEVHAGHDIRFNGGNIFQWQYLNPLQAVQQSTLPSAPLTFVSSE